MRHHLVKMIAALLVVLTLITSFQPITQAAAKQASVDWKGIYTNYLTQFKPPQEDVVNYGLALMDVNMDGLPELVMSGTSYARSNYIYTIKNGKVTALGGFVTSYEAVASAFMNIKLYKDKKTKAFKWVARNGVSNLDDDGIEITFVDMNTDWSKMTSFHVYLDTGKNKKHWKVNNKETTEATYNKKYKEAFANLEEQTYPIPQYSWNPKSSNEERKPVIERMMKEYKSFTEYQAAKVIRLNYTSYTPESMNVTLQKDFDMDGNKDKLVLSQGKNAPKLMLNMNKNGSISMELTDYEWGRFKKILCGDITGDGLHEVLILADMGGNGADAGNCALYGFTKNKGKWSSISFPFLEEGSILDKYLFTGKFISDDVISVSCQPYGKTVDVINNDKIQFGDGYLNQTYKSSGLTDIEFQTDGKSKAYNLQLLQQMKNSGNTGFVGYGITQFSCVGGNFAMITQRFRFK